MLSANRHLLGYQCRGEGSGVDHEEDVGQKTDGEEDNLGWSGLLWELDLSLDREETHGGEGLIKRRHRHFRRRLHDVQAQCAQQHR